MRSGHMVIACVSHQVRERERQKRNAGGRIRTFVSDILGNVLSSGWGLVAAKSHTVGNFKEELRKSESCPLDHTGLCFLDIGINDFHTYSLS